MNKHDKDNTTAVISQYIGQLMLDKKAHDIVILDVRGITTVTDFFILCTSDSPPQTKAISDHIEDELIRKDIKPWHIEGMQKKEWVLMDYINIVVNIFSQDARDFYQLERLWGDAVITEVKEIEK